jgi:hypothetical protein
MFRDCQKEIEEIIGKMKCPKNFKCYKSGYENLCKAKDVGLESYLECLEGNPSACKFLIMHRNIFYCSCPLRVYIAKKIETRNGNIERFS